MRALPWLCALALALLAPSAALADAIGGPCPSGQIYQANPTPPGAMHHGGGQCVPDPNASHCAAQPGHPSGGVSALAAGLGLAVAFGARRSRRDKVRSRWAPHR